MSVEWTVRGPRGGCSPTLVGGVGSGPRGPLAPGAQPLPTAPPAYSRRTVLVSPRATTQHAEVARGIRSAHDPGDTRGGGPARLRVAVCEGVRAAADWTRARRRVEPYLAHISRPSQRTPRARRHACSPWLTLMEWRRSRPGQSGEPDGRERFASQRVHPEQRGPHRAATRDSLSAETARSDPTRERARDPSHQRASLGGPTVSGPPTSCQKPACSPHAATGAVSSRGTVG